jgi:hypothetical protein
MGKYTMAELQFIGKVAHGSLAQGIDDELYGT